MDSFRTLINTTLQQVCPICMRWHTGFLRIEHPETKRDVLACLDCTQAMLKALFAMYTLADVQVFLSFDGQTVLATPEDIAAGMLDMGEGTLPQAVTVATAGGTIIVSTN